MHLLCTSTAWDICLCLCLCLSRGLAATASEWTACAGMCTRTHALTSMSPAHPAQMPPSPFSSSPFNLNSPPNASVLNQFAGPSPSFIPGMTPQPMQQPSTGSSQQRPPKRERPPAYDVSIVLVKQTDDFTRAECVQLHVHVHSIQRTSGLPRCLPMPIPAPL